MTFLVGIQLQVPGVSDEVGLVEPGLDLHELAAEVALLGPVEAVGEHVWAVVDEFTIRYRLNTTGASVTA